MTGTFLTVLNPGLFSTVQDLGRPGFREWGVGVAGAFDGGSMALANALVGNPPGAAALEMTLVGGSYRAEGDLAIALAGATMAATLAGPDGERSLRIPSAMTLRAGERLVLGPARRGARTYLAVRGGWRTPEVLGSRSTEQALRPGDALPAFSATTPARWLAGEFLPDPTSGPIRVLDGPDADGRIDWEGLESRVGSRSDRKGLRLDGPAVSVEPDPGRLSTPVAPGAVQVTERGLIVLGVACGTMGGYPHVAHVVTADLDRLAQARPGDRITFQRIELEAARALDRADRRARAELVERVARRARGAVD
jgi:biotin-dependent carboxylase-like uncharacterized protein